MRTLSIAARAICLATLVGCASELAERPRARDPASAAAADAPFTAPPSYQPDPLLSLAPRQEPRSEPPATTIYVCPMHPDVRQAQPGKCHRCGMTLVPTAAQNGGQ
jgi:hypothetical protein